MPWLSGLIVLVEDSQASATAVGDYLRTLGHKVLLAQTGQEVIDLADQHAPDMILLDAELPDMGSLEVTRRVRRLANQGAPRPYIVLVASRALPEDRSHIIAAGADECLGKPLVLSALGQLIQHHLVRTRHLPA